jgi:Methyltransferase domain
MKLSQLIELRNRLKEAYNVSHIRSESNALMTALGHLRDQTEGNYHHRLSVLCGDLNKIENVLEINSKYYEDTLAQLESEMSAISHKMLGENYDLEIKYDIVENIRKIRNMHLPDDVRSLVQHRLKNYTDWQYPALEIGCRDGEWTKLMVAADPLYLVDVDREFLDSAIKDFPEMYQQRVRTYVAKDSDLSMLPQGQFGFMFCWNYLNYRGLESFKQYLKTAMSLLRPGGVFMFSYNNGEMVAGAGHAENFFMTYIPKTMLLSLIYSLGFEVVDAKDFHPAVSWVEVRKPGELNTIKANQVLGKIKRVDA